MNTRLQNARGYGLSL